MTVFLLILFVIIGLILAFLGVNVLRTLFTNFRPSKNKIQEDIRQMRAEIEPFVNQLVPLDNEELELFSLNQLNQSLKKGITTQLKGIYTSIYQEPLVAYSYKKYLGGYALLYARTATREIIYKISKKETKVAVNQNYYGTVRNGALYGKNKRQALAQVNRNSNELALPILVENQEIAMLNPLSINNTPQPRAFRYVKDNINEEQEQAFMTLAILEMVRGQVD